MHVSRQSMALASCVRKALIEQKPRVPTRAGELGLASFKT